MVYNVVCISIARSQPASFEAEVLQRPYRFTGVEIGRDKRRQELEKQIAVLQVKVRRERQFKMQWTLQIELEILTLMTK